MSRATKAQRRERRKERRSRSNSMRLHKQFDQKLSGRGLQLISYDVSYDKLDLNDEPDPALELLDDPQRQELMDQLTRDPQTAIERLRALLEKWPDSRTLSNWLAAAYSSARDMAGAERMARELYRRHPDYLFARLGMAQVYMERGEVEQIPILFNNTFELKMLYPHRKVFHITEVLGFNSVMVEFLMRTDRPREARAYFDIMNRLEPDHPLTQAARRVVYGSRMLGLVKKVQRRLVRYTRSQPASG